jgi:hypothetical protein
MGLLDAYSYFRHRSNWHKLPVIRDLICAIGRHDFELRRVDGENLATLECFYCEAQKRSHAYYGGPLHADDDPPQPRRI